MQPHPLYAFVSYDHAYPQYYTFVLSSSFISIPKTTGEALSHLGWHQAMIDEMSTLYSNSTWDLVSCPHGKFVLGCHWVFTVKVGPNGHVDRLKAWLIA